MSPKGRDAAEQRRRMEEVAGHAAQEHAADEAFERPEPASHRWVVALVLALAAAGVVAWDVREMRSGTPPLPAPEQERSLVGVITVLSRQIEAVRRDTGVYPATLDAVAPPLEGVTYRRTEGGFALDAMAGEVLVTFVSDRNPQLLTERVRPAKEDTP